MTQEVRTCPRWENFSKNELQTILRGLRTVDVAWVESASLTTVKQTRSIRNRRDAMVKEIQAELDHRRALAEAAS